MDTVLGLSLTPTTIGWVLVEGHYADGDIVDHDDFGVPRHTGGGAHVVNTSEQVTAAVLHAQATGDHRLHVIGLTWSDESAAEAALLIESLTEAGFDNVVPVRLLDALKWLARGIGPTIGYDKTAVCVVERGSTTVVMVDTCDNDTQSAVKHVAGGADGLVRWLARMFDRSTWRPDGVVVVGSAGDLDAISWQLDTALPVPVFTQTGAELALARGAALASTQSPEFTDVQVLESATGHGVGHPRSRPSAYAGAMTMLVAAALTFVGSLSLAVGLRVIPERTPVQRVVHTSTTPHIAKAPVLPPPEAGPPAANTEPPVAEEPVVVPSAEPQSGPSEEPDANLPAAEPVAPPSAPAPPPAPPESNPHPLLTKLLERLRGQHEDPAPEESAPPQAPPPNAGAPSP